MNMFAKTLWSENSYLAEWNPSEGTTIHGGFR